MSSEEKTTAKVKAEPAGADPVAGLLKTIMKLGGLGTGSLAVLILGAVAWLKSEIQSSVREVVRAEIAPIEKRVTALEVEAEVQKRTQTK